MEKKEIKILVYKRTRINWRSLKRWNRHTRDKVNPYAWRPRTHKLRMPTSIDNKKKLGEWMYRNFGYGMFRISGFTKGYTKTRIRFITIARLEIQRVGTKDSKDNYVAVFSDLSGLARYGFWKKEQP